MKLYGNPLSTCTRKVLTTLAETNIPYEFVVLDLAKGEHKEAEHLARQPFGQIPVLEDGSLEMYESRAIIRYLAEKARSPLIPSDIVDRARMEQWISVETSDFSGHAMKFVAHDVFKRPQPQEVLDAAHKGLSLALDVLDARLAQQPYLAGKAFSLADICFMPYIEYAIGTQAKSAFTERKHVSTWWTRVSERPSWQKILGR